MHERVAHPGYCGLVGREAALKADDSTYSTHQRPLGARMPVATTAPDPYVRTNMLSNFGGRTLLFDEFGIGLLQRVGGGAGQPPIEPRTASRP